MRFARVHVFPYSARPGTLAATMPDHVNPQVRRQRACQVREIARLSSGAFRQQFVGRTLPVLWETQLSDGRWSGLTDNYLRVFAESRQNLANTLCPIYLSGVEPDGMCGQIIRAQAGEP